MNTLLERFFRWWLLLGIATRVKRMVLCGWLGRFHWAHQWRSVTFNDEFTGYVDCPGQLCQRCWASMHDEEAQ